MSANYIKVKPSLLGQEYFRQDSNSHILYSGALYNYSLVPLLLISNYDPIRITIFFALLNLFIGFAIYLVTKEIFGFRTATISTIIFLFNDFMIYHSLFIWNYNYLPLVGILILYFSWRYLKFKKLVNLFLVGVLCGIGVSLQFLFAPLAISVLIINSWKNKRWLLGALIFILGAVLGNLPMVLFDLRHNFYETQTLFQYLIDTLRGKSGATFAYYYLLPFWPVASILGGLLIVKISNWRKLLGALILLIYLYLNITSQRVSFTLPTGMPAGIKVSDIDNASRTIADNADGDFNVSEVLDFDKRAYVLRYYLEFVYAKKPLGETEYQNIKTLYVLSQKDYNFDNSGVWEVNSGGKYQISLLSFVGKSYAVYKLYK